MRTLLLFSRLNMCFMNERVCVYFHCFGTKSFLHTKLSQVLLAHWDHYMLALLYNQLYPLWPDWVRKGVGVAHFVRNWLKYQKIDKTQHVCLCTLPAYFLLLVYFRPTSGILPVYFLAISSLLQDFFRSTSCLLPVYFRSILIQAQNTNLQKRKPNVLVNFRFATHPGPFHTCITWKLLVMIFCWKLAYLMSRTYEAGLLLRNRRIHPCPSHTKWH